MANKIEAETIEYVGILAKLALSEEEKEQAKKDMESMLDYMEKLKELDTEGVEPMSHLFSMDNVFRDDVECEKEACTCLIAKDNNKRNAILSNAPEQKNGSFKVPKTIE